ncbi:MAG: hypothetical protein L0Z50_11815 [Verrucomicrobiales bacterium]|nr:hypothetical protein [Verrucomicrobiales bacterium]
MKTRTYLLIGSLSVIAFLNVPQSAAQELPTKQPGLLHILRERVKVGRADDHTRSEAEWVAAYEKAKYPYGYLAVSSMTGPSEVWYIVPSDSHAEMGKIFEEEQKNPTLASDIARLTRADAEFIESVQALHAAARPELSYGDYPDIAKARFFEIGILRVRPGHAAEVEKAAKAYVAARKKAGVKGAYRVYSVIAGMPSPTYLIFSSVESFGDLDQAHPDHLDSMKAMSEEDRAQLEKAWADGVILDETNRYRVEPKQSYVSKETRARDPKFWSPQ